MGNNPLQAVLPAVTQKLGVLHLIGLCSLPDPCPHIGTQSPNRPNLQHALGGRLLVTQSHKCIKPRQATGLQGSRSGPAPVPE